MERKAYIQSKVSMVMPCYNKKDGIGFMLESIYNQNWDNVELILVNDGSTDGTREIIAEWEPKLRERGYEVVIIDQENAGVGAAVKNGMLNMTGDLFCTVDADDWLYPEYLSTMALWLDENPEYDYSVCNYEMVTGTKEKRVVRKASCERPELLNTENRIERLLMDRIPGVPWKYVVRKSFLQRCKVIDNFVESPITQEPSLVLPLALGDGLLKVFPQVLYRWWCLDDGSRDWKKYSYYFATRATLFRQVIARYPMDNAHKRRKLLKLCELYGLKAAFTFSRNFNGREEEKQTFARVAAEFANQCFEPCPNVSSDDIIFTSYSPFFFALEDCILGVKRPSVKAPFDALGNKRVIAYGALGRVSKHLLPSLLKSALAPRLIWDAAAELGQTIDGVAVEKPDFSILREDDVFIVLPKNSSVIEEVAPLLEKAGVKNIVNHFELVQYLGECYYPCFQSEETKWREGNDI